MKSGNTKNKKLRVESIKTKAEKYKSKKVRKNGGSQIVVCMSGGFGYNEIADIERVIQLHGNPSIGINFMTDYIFTPYQYL